MKLLNRFAVIALLTISVVACNNNTEKKSGETATTEASDGVKMIEIETPAGKYIVWTKRVGENPKVKVLLLHGGPGGNHLLFEPFERYFPKEGFEFYYYDQLGSYKSDKPTDSSLWTTARFVEEVEQVRKALGLNKDNFFLLGHSWGGILATEYALKYQDNLKALVISNMMSSCPDYSRYAETVLAKQMAPKVLDSIKAIEARKDFSNPRYMELLIPNFYAKHVCRIQPFPATVDSSFAHINSNVYTIMQGPSEFGISGRLANWDRKADLKNIKVPTLTIGGQHDTMDPDHMKWMATQVQNGTSLICPNGSHCSMWDDSTNYFTGLISFIKKNQ